MKETIMRVCERIMAYLDPVRLDHIDISTEEIRFSLKGHVVPGVPVTIRYSFGVWLVLDRPRREGEPELKPGEHDLWVSDVTLCVDGVEKGSRLDRVSRADFAKRKLVSVTLPNHASMSYGKSESTEEGA